MNRINVELISHSPIYNAILGARTCWQSFNRDDYENEENIGKNNEDLLRRLIQRYKHESVIEHVAYTFKINWASRGFLQQLARHRIASYSVQSTRYTLKNLLDEEKRRQYHRYKMVGYTRLKKKFVEEFLVLPPNISDEDIEDFFEILGTLVRKTEKYKNDVAKYFLPEAWRTEIVWTINARSLRNFLNLRLKPDAHFEIRHIANLVVKTLPKPHLILFEDLLEV